MHDRIEQRPISAQAVTSGPKQHFFGYYDKNQFDPSDRYLLGLECDVIGRMQTPDDRAGIGVVDLEADNAWVPVAETMAWSWQMGCMAEWTSRICTPCPSSRSLFAAICIRAGTVEAHRSVSTQRMEVHGRCISSTARPCTKSTNSELSAAICAS